MSRWSYAGWILVALTAAVPVQADLGATPVDQIKVPKGFQVELLYSVPREKQGSWVSLTVDDKGRLIAGDQYGKLYRITPPAKAGEEIQIELIDLEMGMAQGLLYAFDSLYVSVNANKIPGADPPSVASGLYRLLDTDGDDKFDTVKTLRLYHGQTEHGPHAVILAPDGKSLYVCAGNHTQIPDPETSRVPRNWDEDFLLSRMWDARGHAQGRLAPGGWIARTDPEGKAFELFSIGFRNEYDIAFNADGELFTYDADMEWDIGTPWYRPTRVNHVTSGSEFGWRSGTGKWPDDYPDSLGSVVDIGPGSPTGIVFGHGAKFPAKYQKALFISDWSYGTVYAVHLTPDGSSYTGEAEKFMLAQPLPVTDLIIHPDGGLYFIIGGRGTQSGLYRVTYVGDESTEPVDLTNAAGQELRDLRHRLEALHHSGAPEDIDTIWPHLNHEDRAIRFAARIALEHQPVERWRKRALAETNVPAAIQAIIALARNGTPDDQAGAIQTLNRIAWDDLAPPRKIDLLRAYALVFIRLGAGTGPSRQSVLDRLDPHFPSGNRRLDRELAQLLIYLEAPHIAERVVALLTHSGTQEDQIQYALFLKDLKTTWTPEARQAYFKWFNQAAAHRGGMSFGGFLKNIRDEAIATLSDKEREELKPILEQKIEPVDPIAELEKRPVVKKYTVSELLPIVETKLKSRDFQRGHEMFATAACFKCHRIRGEGGTIGPDLTGVGRRFNNQNLLESIIEPSKVISDQFQMTQFVLSSGKAVTGRIINLAGNDLRVMTNMLDPSSITAVKRDEIELMRPSPVSMMPEGLLDRLTEEEILDLVAYLKSGGDPDHEVFQMPFKTTTSGLKFRVLEKGDGASPGPTDTVVCHYRGWLDNGTEFDSSYKRGEPATFPLNGVIAGWTEGLQRLSEGGKIELEIPAKLGYGERGIPGVIPGGATLHFVVELIEVQ